MINPNSGRILIVDDVPENLRLLSSTLTDAGYEVRGVVTGTMAKLAARSATPDLILLDIRLPDLTGYEVCQQLKADPRTCDIPVIFLSALDDTLDKVRAFSVGGVDYITKPFQLEEVLARIQNHLALQRAKIQIRELNTDLEQRVQQRTAQLEQTNQQLMREIAERENAESALRESEARFRLLAENMSDLVCLHEPDGRYLYVSPSCEALLGFSSDELIGLSPYQFFHPDDLEHIRLQAHQPILRGESISTTYRFRKKSGEYIWLETLAKPLLNTLGQVIRMQTASRDVTERVTVQAQLTHDALHDTLTDLPNRVLFMKQVELALKQATQRADYLFTVLFIDLDRFKLVNDSLGHLIGDQLLVAIARILESCLRPNDIVARLGGDEFTILLDNTPDLTTVIKIVDRIQHRLNVPLLLEGHTVFTTASIGIVFGLQCYEQAVDLLRDADTAMYRAKEGGRNRYEIFNHAMHVQAMERLHLENALRQALDRQEFILHYQPIFELKSRTLVGFEALVRWQHPEQGLVYPNAFISVAEDSGLISRLGQYVLHQACQQLSQWQAQYPNTHHLAVSVNISSQQFRQPHFIQQLDEVLEATHLNGACLKLEITESMLIEDLDTVSQLLACIKQRHIQLSIDDFGTGYSSLSYLHRLPINTLKIDRSFVAQMNADLDSQEIVRAIVSLAHTLGMDVIAEGVETLEQLEQLHRLDCEFGQGYFFSQPIDAMRVQDFLTSLA
ncbi:MAG TPA: EAL domain-containing protein [Coleofasciculaceae cyanobacterium]|jgi:diguanylate cyclase (GGDEF)-like protein/PAS domain S-box-containing protein